MYSDTMHPSNTLKICLGGKKRAFRRFVRRKMNWSVTWETSASISWWGRSGGVLDEWFDLRSQLLPSQKKNAKCQKQAGCFSQTAEPRLSLCTFLCCGGGFSTFQDGIGKLLPELVQSTKDAWQGDQSSLVKKPWKTNGWKPKIGDLEVFLLFQGDFTGSGGVRKRRDWGGSRVAALFRNEIQLTNYKFLTLFHAAYTSPRFLAHVDIFQNKKGKKEL